ncbi:DEAD/DEAH box helicase [Pseudoruegeria sp. SK021]|uniref:DEAD/DEAH box helicase n=1 Tax=Pseudoruegeria sp. SK021 TaxID=1933035 RepID=UPI000A247394|nr:DEAD/DEAH box helicase [Pseudoruegeria sp. SK021]OSP56605.1 ATP-dependent RNA helicase [Pseudoruegeria sp. SK021]
MIPTLSEALAAKGYTTLTAVQEAVSDPSLGNTDLLVSAQTGSGKTVGFGLAIAPTLLGEDDRFGKAATPLALVIAPTRELALQVQREFQWLYGQTGAIIASCVGGMDMRTERRNLDRGAHIVVGTPGRLRDHLMRNSLDMTDIRAVVLDEADEMLDLGFREDLEFILGTAPDDRRTLMFSATVPSAIAALAKNYQKPDAKRISTVSSGSQHSDIEYQALNVGNSDVESGIINVLRFHEAPTAMVFCNTRAMVSRLTARFSNRGFSVVALSGELSQTERTHALQAMRDGRARICVATDVAARGIDLPNLDLVIHADLPSNSDTLLHRSGRTGRAGRQGISTLIVPGSARKKAERLLKFAKITAEWGVPPSADDVLRRDEERLLSDPVWSTPGNPDDAEFVANLLAEHGPEAIANAYLALYRAGRSAPEDLATPQAPRPREAFGPSGWVSLSVGRAERAEPRWLLPMLCRMGNIDKTQIGAIRVQETETFVELGLPGLDSLMTAIAPGMALEDGIAVRRLDGTPDIQPHSSHKPGGAPRPPRRPERAPSAPSAPRSAPETSYDPLAGAGGVVPPEAPAPRKPRHVASAAADVDAPRSKPAYAKTSGPKPPYKGKSADGDKPRGKAPYKPRSTEGDDRPRSKAPYKPRGEGAPQGRFGGDDSRPRSKPASAGAASTPYREGASDPSKPMRKPRAGAAGKPAGKPGGFSKAGAKPGGPRKPAGPRKPGGDGSPRR